MRISSRAGSAPEDKSLGDLPAGDDDGIDEYQEYLDQNELGLAMDILAEVGEERGAARPFWAARAVAPRSMGQIEQAEKFGRRATA